MINQGTWVGSKSELAALLRHWLDGTKEPTIGDVGTFGRKRWIRLSLPEGEMVLNADTKREAVEVYLADTARRGPEVPWRVVPTMTGRLTKVLYMEEGSRAPGWYCYLVADAL